MANQNLIDKSQLNQNVWGMTSGIVSGSLPLYLNAYLSTGGSLNSNFLDNFSTQSISGQKNFLVSPNVPYSGGTGSAVSFLYLSNQLGIINSGLNPLLNNSFLLSTGSQVNFSNIVNSGNFSTSFLFPTNSASYNVNLNSSFLLDSSSVVSIDWNNRNLQGNWNLNGGTLLSAQGNQIISGVNTFAGEIVVPNGINTGNAVNFGQLQFYLGSLPSNSGFAGISSINGATGAIFTQGRGTVTAYQVGNILSISGAQINTGILSAVIQSQVINLSSGINIQRVNFPSIYAKHPIVFCQLFNSGLDPQVSETLSGVDLSGFYTSFSTNLPSNNYILHYLALDASGALNTLQGQQGLLGPYLQPEGSWITGTTYSFLNFVTVPNGASFACINSHLSTTGTNPLTSTGYWTLLASGAGPAGQNAYPFTYQGAWNMWTAYNSGNSVYYNGSSYGTTTGTSIGQAPTGNPWFLIAAGASGIGINFEGFWKSGSIYINSNVVRFNDASWIYTNLTGSISGLNFNPTSSNSPWTLFTDRVIAAKGSYSPFQSYYKNNLIYLNTGFSSPQSIEYINNSDATLLGLHPFGYYNQFIDCDGFTGVNLLELTTGINDQFNPLNNSGSVQSFIVNNNTLNAGGSGWDTITLLRGQPYYFDCSLLGNPFILTTNNSGNNYNNQIINNVYTGHRLSVSSGNYVAAGLGQSFSSGTLLFLPDTGNPDVLYLQSPNTGFMGIKILLKNNNPWSVFNSGIIGPQGTSGASGQVGQPGLAFSWKGNWSALTNYISGNSVYYNGSSYGTNQSVIGTQPTNAPWFPIAIQGSAGLNAQGLAFMWRGNWSSSSGYNPSDSVYYNGSSYATNTTVSGNFPPPSFPAFWFPVALSGSVGPSGTIGAAGLAFNFQGNYTAGNTYNSGQAVYYNGSSYGLTGSGSFTNIPPDYTGINPWSITARGGGLISNWRGIYNVTITYNSGDAVFYNGSSYGTQTTSTAVTPDPLGGTWYLIAEQGGQGIQGPIGPTGLQGEGGLAFNWRGNWNALNTYFSGDSVFYSGSSYGTLNDITTIAIPSISANWFLLAQQGSPGLAFNWLGNWNPNILYQPNQAVYYNGRSYGTNTFISSGIIPSPSSVVWNIIADKGGNQINESYYNSGAVSQSIHPAIMEKFAPTAYTITGYMVGLIAANYTDSSILSGTIYRRNTSNSKFTLANFALSSGIPIIINGGLSGNVNNGDRLGIDISGGPLAGTTGLSIGVFGWAPSP